MTFNPRTLRYDRHGVPYLKATEIEAIAYEVLEKYCHHWLTKPGITPVAKIIQGLHQNTSLLFAWTDLGFKGTAKILGTVNFTRKTLALDTVLDKERKSSYRFTAAHEIGHWVLHRHNWKNLRLAEGDEAQDEFSDDDSSLCRLDQRTPGAWLEFQANVFAASLVMPRKPFQEAVVTAQLAMGIRRNLGEVYLSEATYSVRDYNELLSRLSLVFDVSRESLRVRLSTMKLLVGEGKATKSVRQALSTSLPGGF